MKRAFDILVSATALLVLAPLLLVVAFLVRRGDAGSALFRQQRIGRDGKPFTLFKFRTMRGAGGPAITAGGDARITLIGARLRRWKLDELPQLWNVLRGDMSLVGPRPEVPEYVRLYPPEGREVLRVRPGITGPSQVEGLDEEQELAGAADPDRYYREVVLPRKLEIDRRYARQAGLGEDVRILLRTAQRMLFRRPGTSHAPVE